MMNLVKSFLQDEEGATAVEYGVMVALIIGVCIAVIKTLGTKVTNAFSTTASSMP